MVDIIYDAKHTGENETKLYAPQSHFQADAPSYCFPLGAVNCTKLNTMCALL